MKIAYNSFTEEIKNEIRDMLQGYVNRFGSVPRAAASLQHVSASTIYSVLRKNYENIADDMWRNIRAQVSTPEANNWVIVDTPVISDLSFFFKEVQEDKDFAWAVSGPGSGKTEAAKKYTRENPNAFHMVCDEAMAKSDFAIELAKAIGLRINTQKKARTIIMEVIQKLSELENPIVIFDEADKLSDSILYFFITIYNRLKDKAGIAFLSTEYMAIRMERGIRLNIKGFPELFSRIGSAFYLVDKNEPYHVDAIIRANGITDDRKVSKLVDETVKAGLDLRRTFRKVEKEKKKIAREKSPGV